MPINRGHTWQFRQLWLNGETDVERFSSLQRCFMMIASENEQISSELPVPWCGAVDMHNQRLKFKRAQASSRITCASVGGTLSQPAAVFKR
jgi:hypothetical protein